jgi:cytochrome d ubiquinol oxidase subunit II
MLELYLPLIWAGIIGVAVAMYVIMDGFDLGIAMLFPFTKDEGERDLLMRSIAPFWDGNETWLVMGGVGLLVAFPLAYAIIMPAFYIPVLLMLIGLVFRGVSFEFRGLANRGKPAWNFAFAAGSVVAALCQGAILGGLVQGIRVADNQFAGGAFDWATPFGLICGLGVVAGYALLGATWLIMKSEGDIAARARGWTKRLLIAVLVFMAIVSLWTPLSNARIAERWFSLPNFFYLVPVPLLTGLVALLAWRALAAGREAMPFLCAIGLFLLGYLGLAISTYPYLVPPALTLWQTAAHPESQIFILIGTLVLLPMILGYTAGIYWLFRGKVRPGEGYH